MNNAEGRKKALEKILVENPNFFQDIRKRRKDYSVANFKDPKKAKQAINKRWASKKLGSNAEG